MILHPVVHTNCLRDSGIGRHHFSHVTASWFLYDHSSWTGMMRPSPILRPQHIVFLVPAVIADIKLCGRLQHSASDRACIPSPGRSKPKWMHAADSNTPPAIQNVYPVPADNNWEKEYSNKEIKPLSHHFINPCTFSSHSCLSTCHPELYKPNEYQKFLSLQIKWTSWVQILGHYPMPQGKKRLDRAIYEQISGSGRPQVKSNLRPTPHARPSDRMYFQSRPMAV